MGLSILCVYTVDNPIDHEKPLRTSTSIPFGISFIASVLKEAGHNVRMLVLTEGVPVDEMLTEIVEECRPRLFCLTAVSTQFPLVCFIAARIKAIVPNAYVLLGGQHATLNPHNAIACPFIDAICLGEGEKAALALAKQLEANHNPSGIQNLWLRRPGRCDIEQNSLAPFNERLDCLPFIDRQMWWQWIEEPNREPSVLAGRGCPNNCSYCSNHALRRITGGRYVRHRSPKNIVQEVAQIVEETSSTEIYIEVETLTVDLMYAFSLCEELSKLNASRVNRIRFRSNISPTPQLMHNETMRNRLFKAFRDANLVVLNVGLESGSERIRRQVLRRPDYSNEEFVRFCRAGAMYGIEFCAFVMIGIPEETQRNWEETIRVLRDSGVSSMYIGMFYPYPGTDLADSCRKDMVRTDLTNAWERRQVAIDLPEFSSRRIRIEYILSYFKVFKGSWPLVKRLAFTLRQLVSTYPGLERRYSWYSRRTRLGRVILNKFR